ncbi:putative reverse transcriptase domain-containing protein [Tanacetum coccineum]
MTNWLKTRLSHISSDDGSLDVGSPGVIILGYDGLPMMPEDLYAYVEAAMQEPPSPYFVPEPVYPEFMPPEDDMLPAKEQSLPATVLPTADSPGYITKSDSEEYPEEDDEDPKEDPTDYPTDSDEDDDEESSGDNADDEEEDEEEEEEHLAPADSVPPPAYRTTARMSIRDQTPIPFPSEAEVDRLLAISTPPPSPLTSYSSPLPQIPSPPLLVSSPLPISPPQLPASPTHSLGYRAAMIRLRAELPSTSHPLPLPIPIVLLHTRESMAMMRVATPSTYILAPRSETPPSGTPPFLPIPLPTSPPPLILPSTDCRVDVPEVTPTGGFRADYGFVSTLDAEIRRDPDREIGYGITNIWVDPDEIAEEVPATDVAELGQRMKDFITTVRQDTDEIYGRLGDAQDDRLLMSGQLNLLRRDRYSHARTARLMEGEARASHEAWVQSMDASDTTRSEKMPPRKASKTRTTRSSPAITTNTTTPMTDEKLKTLIAQGVADVLAERDATRSINGKDKHDSGMGVRRQAPFARECTYPDFMKCKPLYFKGTEGVFELTQCFERMETVFRISNCTMENQIKFATCTLLRSALRGGTPTLELLVTMMFLEESDKIERYVSGLPGMIHGSVMAFKPKTMQDAIEFATELMDKKINTFAERQAENKRKFDDTSRNNQNQQQQNKKQNTSKAYTAGSGKKKPYGGSKPLCSKCNYHHDGQCAPKCHKCNRVGHLAHDCRSPASANTANNQRGTGQVRKLLALSTEPRDISRGSVQN